MLVNWQWWCYDSSRCNQAVVLFQVVDWQIGAFAELRRKTFSLPFLKWSNMTNVPLPNSQWRCFFITSNAFNESGRHLATKLIMRRDLSWFQWLITTSAKQFLETCRHLTVLKCICQSPDLRHNYTVCPSGAELTAFSAMTAGPPRPTNHQHLFWHLICDFITTGMQSILHLYMLSCIESIQNRQVPSRYGWSKKKIILNRLFHESNRKRKWPNRWLKKATSF